MPEMGAPLKLADFFTQGYRQGGVNSVLALDGLFILMTRHNLDYPAFYGSLLAQLTPAALHARHRARLFRMLDLCLASSHLAAAAAAAFAKRLLRLALLAPPPAALFALALARRVLDAHPQCRQMISREEAKAADAKEAAAAKAAEAAAKRPPVPLPDSIETADDLLATSSLWEISALRRHYHPSVSVVARGFAQKAGGSASSNAQEFAALTYKALFDQEMKRNLKSNLKSKAGGEGGMPVAFAPPRGLLRSCARPDGEADFDVFAGTFAL
eukprot:TRINITY_DN5847_c0_g1_i7.p2 TRINITY_DN5847_c0_g1~~TRINITY_DN5847_c0_g1_i7.p2  ORF type:complete len:271 (+),score=123.63 TRINITY_DN5847_c0_g1_i7:405-1217(+)